MREGWTSLFAGASSRSASAKYLQRSTNLVVINFLTRLHHTPQTPTLFGSEFHSTHQHEREIRSERSQEIVVDGRSKHWRCDFLLLLFLLHPFKVLGEMCAKNKHTHTHPLSSARARWCEWIGAVKVLLHFADIEVGSGESVAYWNFVPASTVCVQVFFFVLLIFSSEEDTKHLIQWRKKSLSAESCHPVQLLLRKLDCFTQKKLSNVPKTTFPNS